MTMEQHEPSGIPSPPPPRDDRIAALPPSQNPGATGQWAAVPSGSPEHVARTAYRSERHVAALERSVGAPPIPATGDPGSGLWARVESGFAGVNTKLDKMNAYIEAELASRASRSSTAGELSWIVVKALVPIGIAALIALASGHLK